MRRGGGNGTSVNWEGAWLPPGANVRIQFHRLDGLNWFPAALCSGSVCSLYGTQQEHNVLVPLGVYKPQVVDVLRTQSMLLYPSMKSHDLAGAWHIVSAH